MTDTEQSLLALLRRALFGQDTPLPPDVDWQRVFEEAVSHSVHLLVYDCLTEQERAAIPKETAAPGGRRCSPPCGITSSSSANSRRC